MMQLFSERLRLRRDRLNLTQDALAEKSGVSKRSIVDYEADVTVPTVKQAEKLALALDCSAGWLLSGETSYPPSRPTHEVVSDAGVLVSTTLRSLRTQAASMAAQIDALEAHLEREAKDKLKLSLAAGERGSRIARMISQAQSDPPATAASTPAAPVPVAARRVRPAKAPRLKPPGTAP